MPFIPRRKQGKLATAVTRQNKASLAELLQLLGNADQQLVGALTAQALVEAAQVIDPQQ